MVDPDFRSHKYDKNINFNLSQNCRTKWVWFGLPLVEHDDLVLVCSVVHDVSEGEEGGRPGQNS
jgi:hypothetical protein